jgi:hypothetical protein
VQIGSGKHGALRFESEQMKDENSTAQADCATSDGDKQGLRKQLTDNETATGAKGETEGDFLCPVGGPGGEQATEIGAGGQQDEPGEEHEAGHEGAGGTFEHVADEAGAGEGEFHAIVFAGVGLREPRADGVEVGSGHGWSDTGAETADEHDGVIAAIFQEIAQEDRVFHHGNPDVGGEEKLSSAKAGLGNSNDGEGMFVAGELTADDMGIAVEVAVPVGITKDDVRGAVLAFLVRGVKEASEIRLDLEGVEVVAAGHVRPGD